MYRKLKDLERERTAWLKKIHDLDKELNKEFVHLTLTQIQDRKKPYGKYHKEVNKIDLMIENGEYEEAQASLVG